jgi:hypothetical protein
MHAQTPAFVRGNGIDNGWVPQAFDHTAKGCGGLVGRDPACTDTRSGKREWNGNGWAPPQQRLRLFSANELDEAAGNLGLPLADADMRGQARYVQESAM